MNIFKIVRQWSVTSFGSNTVSVFRLRQLLFGVIFFFGSSLSAQNEFDIRFALDTVDCVSQTVCYQVQVRSSNGVAWGLAGQNYRLYYNSALISWQTGTSLLPSSYQNFTLVQDVQNVNAGAVNGNLNFEDDLGFLNYAIDLNNVSAGGIPLPADGTWIPTTQLCFDITDPVLLTDPSTCLEIVWARDGMTNEYALSFVEISEWVMANTTTPANGDVYDDLDPTDGEASCFETSCVDPTTNYDIRLDFDSMDCITNTVCYNVQIRDPNSAGWGLAGQNYRIYYDASLASWQTGVSTLGSDYQNFTLIQDIQNVNAPTASGNLSFESTLSFLNYTMDLNNPATGGISLPSDTSWLTTSQLCFTVEPILLSDPGTCLEAVWARDGLTNEYATSFVEISEWVGVNDTEMAEGATYDDLESSDGEASCFETSCISATTDYDIRLDFDSLDCNTNTVCYNVQIRDPNSVGWGLAGQNYRIYYDASLASWQSGVSTLGGSYQDFTLIQDIQGVNAVTASGNLSFEDSLSFLNYTMDLFNPAVGGINLPNDTSWLTTSQLCFEVAPILLNDPGTCLEAIWARDGLTNEYATSFVEVSEWVAANDTEMANGATYDDLESSDGDASCFTQGCDTEYDIRLSFDTLDCINSLACYNVQLRDPNNAGWGLAGQNYRIYYDASLASWQSGVSTLGGSYQDFTLIQDIQDVNAVTASGNLSFENTLSFLNYTMDLNDPAVGGINLPNDTTWLTTSQLCFEVEPILLNDPGTCLEAIWARDGLTNEYATSFVEVSEWVAANDTEMANGATYDDLESSDGDASCFPNSCLFDYGDLADTSAVTGTGDYQTLLANNGPRHLIIPTLNIGGTVDNETDGSQSNMADGDGADEDGFSFPSTLSISPNNTIQLPLTISNTSGSTAHFEAWIDWNGDGDFDDMGEMIFDLSDDGAGDLGMNFISISIPTDAVQNQDLGARFRLSNQDGMTPLGTVGSGEIEDYLIQIECPTQTCIPLKVTVKRS